MQLRYWMEQIGASSDLEGVKPIVVVGTHADKLDSEARSRIHSEMEALYPVSTPQRKNRHQIQAHFCVSLAQRNTADFLSLQSKLVDISLNHNKIGIGSAQVPRNVLVIQQACEELKQRKYIPWSEYVSMASSYFGAFLPQ